MLKKAGLGKPRAIYHFANNRRACGSAVGVAQRSSRSESGVFWMSDVRDGLEWQARSARHIIELKRDGKTVMFSTHILSFGWETCATGGRDCRRKLRGAARGPLVDMKRREWRFFCVKGDKATRRAVQGGTHGRLFSLHVDEVGVVAPRSSNSNGRGRASFRGRSAIRQHWREFSEACERLIRAAGGRA